MAFPAIAALASAAAAEVTVTMVLAAVAEVGITMTVVGAVTGSEDLMKIGSVLGLVGGVGGMIAGAASGAASAAAGETLSEAATQSALDAASAEALTPFTSTAADVADEMVLSEMGQAATPGIVTGPTQLQPTPLEPIGAVPTQAVHAPQAVATDVPVIEAPTGPVGPQGAQAPTTPFDANANPTDIRLANGTQTSPMGPPDSTDSFWAKFSKFAKDNKELVNSGVQLVGGAFKGANEADMWDQKMSLERDKWNRGNSAGTFGPRTRSIVGGAA